MNLISEQHLQQIDGHLMQRVTELFAKARLDAFASMTAEYLRGGGKRIRPQLAVWTYRHASGRDEPLNQTLLDLAAGWEMFHAFLLVHDDIIDASDTRRNAPSLHRQLASLDSDSLHFGTSLGIVAGDLLYTGALRLWHRLDVDRSTHLDLLELFDNVAALTGFGQAIDIIASHRTFDQIDESTLLNEYAWKTAAYTFEGPMLSGAILAGLDQQARTAISQFALSIGQAYQLHNDLLDLSAVCHEGSDLVQGKRTITLMRHRTGLEQSAQHAFDQRLSEIASGNGHAVQLAERLRADLLNVGVLDQTQQLIDELLAKATSACDSEGLPSALSVAMKRLMAGLSRDYFVKPAQSASA